MTERLKPYRDWAILYWRKVLAYSLLALIIGALSHQIAIGFNRIEELVTKSDRNGRALDCILTALDTGDSIKREAIQECRRKVDGPTGNDNPDVPTPDPKPVVLSESPATMIINQTVGGAPAGPGNANQPPPPPPAVQPPLLLPGAGQGLVRDGETVLGLPLGRL